MLRLPTPLLALACLLAAQSSFCTRHHDHATDSSVNSTSDATSGPNSTTNAAAGRMAPPPSPVVVADTSPPPAVGTAAPSIELVLPTDASSEHLTTALSPMDQEVWEVGQGEFRFEADGTVRCVCRTTSSLLWHKGPPLQDFDAEVEVMFLGHESSAGILFRATGRDFYADQTFYQFEWYTHGSHHDRRLSLMKKNPYWVQIVEPKYPDAPYGTWLRLRVRAVGERLQTFVDGDEVFARTDATFRRAGRLGLHIFQPRPVRFRGFRLTRLDSP